MVILVATITTGTDVDAIAAYTKSPRELVAGIAGRMRAAGLWTEAGIEDRNLWLENGDINLFTLFKLARIGAGQVDGHEEQFPAGITRD